MVSTITLNRDYGYEQYTIEDLAAGTVVDATNATFIQDNNSDDDGRVNEYPVAVRNSADLMLQGGTVLGDIDQTTDRDIVYHYDPGNSAAIRAEDAPNLVIRDWRIDKTWDGIRVSWNTQNFLIEDVWISNARDDAVENDKLNSGTIRDCLFDGVMGGISLDPSSSSPVNGSGEDVTIDGVLLRMKEYLSEGEVTHGSPLKVDKDLPMPDLHITNSVFAIEDVDHNGQERLAIAWDNVVESSGNVFLNLSDKPLPSDYPMPQKGWTVLQGQEARDYWNDARDAWVKAHADGADDTTDPTPVPVEDDPSTPVPDGDSSTFDGVEFKGSNSGETIIGNALDNYIDGNNGNDFIYGGSGNDTIRSDNGADELWGGAGNDVFFFKHASDSRDSKGIDTIRDFTHGDKIDLSEIDADRDARGDQAFHLVTGEFTGAGQLTAKYDASTGYTVVEANMNHNARAEVTIQIDGHIDLTEADFIL